MGKTLFFSRDPGAANSVISFYDSIRSGIEINGCESIDIHNAIILCKDYSVDIWSGYTKNYQKWDDVFRQSIDAETISTHLLNLDITQLVTGTTDVDDRTDTILWEIAKKNNIKSYCIIDNPATISERFINIKRKYIFPDIIYVHDGSTKNKLINLGVTEKSIIIINNLHLNRVQSKKCEVDIQKTRTKLRQKWKIEENSFVILLTSSAVSEVVKNGRNIRFSEHDIIRETIETIKRGTSKLLTEYNMQSVITLIIRPHPRDSIDKYDSYTSIDGVNIIVSSFGSSIDSILSCDLLLSISPAAFDEAVILGKKAHMLVDWKNGEFIPF